ncbi:FecR family protein [Xylophilus sp. ASV27]|uniref:FecR family protein n=1 Tax=Xylophilus sp. ASV27 TaxID=2795129 RepID=UPI0018ED6758|nr:FecR domain-containing protein [Xylophilus sp. ASV27]
MKTTGIRTVGVLLMAWAMALPAGAAEPAPRAGTVKLVKGQVRVQNASGERALQSGDALSTADRVVTGADSSVSVVLRDGTVVVIGPASRLELKAFDFDTTTHEGNLAVALLRGTLRMVTGLIGKTRHDAVKVETPTSTVGILGTDFIVEALDPAAAGAQP